MLFVQYMAHSNGHLHIRGFGALLKGTSVVVFSGESAVQQPYHPVAQDGFPMKLSRVEPGQYLDGRPPGKK